MLGHLFLWQPGKPHYVREKAAICLLYFFFPLFSLTYRYQNSNSFNECLEAWMNRHGSYVHLRMVEAWTEACVWVLGAGEWARGKVLCLACSWGPSGLSLQPSASLYHSYIMLHLCENIVTPNLGISMFSLQLDCQDYRLIEKMLQPLGFWGPFKINSITLNKHACEAWNKFVFFTVATKNLTFWKYKVFSWQQQ